MVWFKKLASRPTNPSEASPRAPTPYMPPPPTTPRRHHPLHAVATRKPSDVEAVFEPVSTATTDVAPASLRCVAILLGRPAQRGGPSEGSRRERMSRPSSTRRPQPRLTHLRHACAASPSCSAAWRGAAALARAPPGASCPNIRRRPSNSWAAVCGVFSTKISCDIRKEIERCKELVERSKAKTVSLPTVASSGDTTNNNNNKRGPCFCIGKSLGIGRPIAAVVVQQQEDWYQKVGVRCCEGPAAGAAAQEAVQGS